MLSSNRCTPGRIAAFAAASAVFIRIVTVIGSDVLNGRSLPERAFSMASATLCAVSR
jgi:hypothetical protein